MINLSPGDKAPAFSGPDQEGRLTTLKDYKGKKLVIYFYPQDDTPACTIQSCNLRDNYSLLKQKGIAVIGISPDSVDSHKKFIDKFSLPFPLIADPTHKIINTYGVWGEKNLYGRIYDGLHRTSFLIDEQGRIVHIIRKPKNKAHAEEIIKKFELAAGKS